MLRGMSQVAKYFVYFTSGRVLIESVAFTPCYSLLLDNSRLRVYLSHEIPTKVLGQYKIVSAYHIAVHT